MKNKPKLKLSLRLRFTGFLTFLSCLGLIYGIVTTFSFLFFAIYAVLVFFLALLTFFTVNYLESINDLFELCSKLFVTVPLVLYFVLALSALSLILLIIKKDAKNKLERKSRIIFNIVIIVLALLLLACHLLKLVSY